MLPITIALLVGGIALLIFPVASVWAGVVLLGLSVQVWLGFVLLGLVFSPCRASSRCSPMRGAC